MSQNIKKIGLLIITCLFLTGFLYLIAWAVGQELITDSFDTNNPNNNPEYYISSKTNLVIGDGQVKLDEDDPCGGIDSVSYGGDIYNTTVIGDQCWLGENLKITNGNTDQSCPGLTRYCYSDNSSSCETYGGLYTWNDMMCGASSCNGTGALQPACSSPAQGICPNGWHIPSHYEWTTLERQICSNIGNTNCDSEFPYDESTRNSGGQDTSNAYGEGSAMAGECGLWYNADLNNNGACNNDFGTSGLNMPPAGYRHDYAGYDELGNDMTTWSSTEHHIKNYASWRRTIARFRTGIYRDGPYSRKTWGFSVRCIKD